MIYIQFASKLMKVSEARHHIQEALANKEGWEQANLIVKSEYSNYKEKNTQKKAANSAS